MMSDAQVTIQINIESIDLKRHDRKRFCSGVDRIDNFFKRTAIKHQKNDYSRVWVATRSDSSKVIGYFAINAHHVEVGELPTEMQRHAPYHGHVPAAYISTIGVDQSEQGQGLGRVLLIEAMKKLVVISQSLGLKIIVLDVLDDGDQDAITRRARFYTRMGFQPFATRPLRMYMAMKTVRQALGEEA